MPSLSKRSWTSAVPLLALSSTTTTYDYIVFNLPQKKKCPAACDCTPQGGPQGSLVWSLPRPAWPRLRTAPVRVCATTWIRCGLVRDMKKMLKRGELSCSLFPAPAPALPQALWRAVSVLLRTRVPVLCSLSLKRSRGGNSPARPFLLQMAKMNHGTCQPSSRNLPASRGSVGMSCQWSNTQWGKA